MKAKDRTEELLRFHPISNSGPTQLRLRFHPVSKPVPTRPDSGPTRLKLRLVGMISALSGHRDYTQVQLMNHETIQRECGGGLVIGTSEHFRWLHGIVKWVLVLNLLDGIFTMVWVEWFDAGEMNIMMSDLVHGNPVLFMLAKLTLVSLGVVFLWRHRSNALAVIFIFVAFLSYYLVFLFHLQYSSTVFL